MKRVLMFSVSVLCLAVSLLIGFHVGSQQVEAQAPAGVQYFYQQYGNSDHYLAILPNGDVYHQSEASDQLQPNPTYFGNFWGDMDPTK